MSKTVHKSGNRTFLYGIVITVLGILSVSGSVFAAVPFDLVKAQPGEAYAVRSCDIDADGYEDIIYSGRVDCNLYIMFGKSDGTYEERVEYPMCATFFEEVYFNDDNQLDIVASGIFNHYFLLNNGDRTFTIDSLAHNYTNNGGISAGYINGDAYTDIITTADSANLCYIMYGDGQGGILSTQTLPYEALSTYVSDFNNDYIDDFIILDKYGHGQIVINNGDGTFTADGTFNMVGVTLTNSIVNPFADFNHDGNADFAFVTNGNPPPNSQILIGFGDGNGGINDITTIDLPGQASYSISISDIDRDHNLDLVIADWTHSDFDIWLGDDNGEFTRDESVSLNSIDCAFAIAAADLNRDGNPDFVAGGAFFYSDSMITIINQLPAKEILPDIMEATAYNNARITIENPDGFEIDPNYCTVSGGDFHKVDWNDDQKLDERIVDRNLQYGTYTVNITAKPTSTPGDLFNADIKIGGETFTLFKDHPVPPVSVSKSGEKIYEEYSFPFYYGETGPISPATGKQALTNVTFDWSGLGMTGSQYQIVIDDRFDFSSPEVDLDNLTEPSYQSTDQLDAGSVYYWKVRAYDGGQWGEYAGPFAVNIKDGICGDLTGNGIVDILDVLFFIDYKFKGGPAPSVPALADCNNDGTVNIMDIIRIISFKFKNGPEPVCP